MCDKQHNELLKFARILTYPPLSYGDGAQRPSGRLFFIMSKIKTIVYVDAFNLYYGAVKGTKYKWLNIAKMSELLLPRHDIKYIHYFTALVKVRPNNPQQAQRQKTYLRALQTIPNLDITYGHFLTQKVRMRLVQPEDSQVKTALVYKTEEKGSDVNLASFLLRDGYSNNFEAAVLITNDSDLLLPIQIVRNDLNKVAGVITPTKKRPSYELTKNASFYKKIRAGVLRASQFPDVLEDDNGVFRKPEDW